MKKNKIIIILLVLVSCIAGVFLLSRVISSGKHGTDMAAHEHGGDTLYQCPMHPQIVQDHPGTCPICHMDLQKMATKSSKAEANAPKDTNKKPLYYRHPMNPSITSEAPAKDDMGMDFIPVYEKGGESDIPGKATVNINLYRQQLIGVKLGEVKRTNLEKTIYTVGRIAFDPMLYQTQEEYLSALRAYEFSTDSPVPGSQERSKQLLDASRLKLRLSGLSDQQIESLAGNQSSDESLLLTSEDGKVWLYADIYEQDLAFVKAGQSIEANLSAEPGKIYEGKIVAIDPILNMKTRTARVRAQITTKEQVLRPGMYANVTIRASIGESLVVPRSAVLFTGKRNIVFVALGDGEFVPRDVRTGIHGEKTIEVLSGLEEGDKIVTSGNFLVDAESQLFGAASGGTFNSGEEADKESSQDAVGGMS